MSAEEMQSLYYLLLMAHANACVDCGFAWRGFDDRKARSFVREAKRFSKFAASILKLDEAEYNGFVRENAAEYIKSYNDLASRFPEVLQ